MRTTVNDRRTLIATTPGPALQGISSASVRRRSFISTSLRNAPRIYLMVRYIAACSVAALARRSKDEQISCLSSSRSDD